MIVALPKLTHRKNRYDSSLRTLNLDTVHLGEATE